MDNIILSTIDLILKYYFTCPFDVGRSQISQLSVVAENGAAECRIMYSGLVSYV